MSFKATTRPAILIYQSASDSPIDWLTDEEPFDR